MSERITVTLIHPRDITGARKFLDEFFTTNHITERTTEPKKAADILIEHRHKMERLAEDWLKGITAPTYRNIINTLDPTSVEVVEDNEDEFSDWVKYIHLIGSGVDDINQVVFDSLDIALDTIPSFYNVYGFCAFNIIMKTNVELMNQEFYIPVKKTENHDELYVRFKPLEINNEYCGIYAEVLGPDMLPTEFFNWNNKKIESYMKNFYIKEEEGIWGDGEREGQEFFRLSEIKTKE